MRLWGKAPVWLITLQLLGQAELVQHLCTLKHHSLHFYLFKGSEVKWNVAHFYRPGLFYKYGCHWFSVTNWVKHPLWKYLGYVHLHSQTIRARTLPFREHVHQPLCGKCHKLDVSFWAYVFFGFMFFRGVGGIFTLFVNYPGFWSLRNETSCMMMMMIMMMVKTTTTRMAKRKNRQDKTKQDKTRPCWWRPPSPHGHWCRRSRSGWGPGGGRYLRGHS